MSENKQSKIMAQVGDTTITRSEIEQFIAMMGQQGTQFHTEEGLKKVADELVNQQLMYLDAKERGLDREERYLAEVEKTKESILKQFAIAELFQSIKVTDDEMKTYYDEHKDRFQKPMQFKAAHILVDSEEKAHDIRQQIAGGESFENMAKEYSTCPSKERGGDLGMFSKGQMVKEFEEALIEQEIGTVSQPVKTQFGYHLIKLNDRKEVSESPFEEVKEQIRQQLTAQKQQELYLKKTNELKSKYSIKKYY